MKGLKEKVDQQNVIRTLIDGGIDKDFKDRSSSRLKSGKNLGITLKYGNVGRANLLMDNAA